VDFVSRQMPSSIRVLGLIMHEYPRGHLGLPPIMQYGGRVITGADAANPTNMVDANESTANCMVGRKLRY
jgi:hypothetical protein